MTIDNVSSRMLAILKPREIDMGDSPEPALTRLGLSMPLPAAPILDPEVGERIRAALRRRDYATASAIAEAVGIPTGIPDDEEDRDRA